MKYTFDLIATDLMTFREWFESCDYIPDIFSALRESSFISNDFIEGYEKIWNKFLPEMGFLRMEDFTTVDVGQLMGPHDIVIRSTFKYLNSGKNGELVIPYTPIYTMTQLSNRV